jgi:hypothetical protein
MLYPWQILKEMVAIRWRPHPMVKLRYPVVRPCQTLKEVVAVRRLLDFTPLRHVITKVL